MRPLTNAIPSHTRAKQPAEGPSDRVRIACVLRALSGVAFIG